jgi:glyoxylase-like metal-dependent hydrolase (beta-lactamase superfamily II)
MMDITKVIVKGFANTYIIKGNEGAILIDTGLPGCEKAILDKCGEKNISLKLIVITHGHFDHIGSAAALKRETEALVAIHTEDAQALRTGISKMDRPVGLIAHLMPLLMRSAKTDPVEPDILIDEEMSLQEYGVDGRILLTPGHTSGSISVMLNSGEAFVGDLIMGGFFGKFRSHRPNLPPFEIGRASIKNSVNYVLEQNPTAIYPSHGGPFDPQDVARWADSL